jgi:DNA-binding transcriptional MerR regulator/methylmalonyl-CoA mutase cobalamin-binding subunit
MDISCSIQVAAKRAGLTAHVIRIWEKRYGAVTPERTGSNRRLYGEEAVTRLRLLGVATRSGHRIGDIARLPTEELKKLAAEGTEDLGPEDWSTPGQALDIALGATRRLDQPALERVLNSALARLGQHGFLAHLVAPLVREVGDAWLRGDLTAAHEHFASGVIRTRLLSASRPYAEPRNAPLMIVTTPAGQVHELGAAMVAAAARDVGWRVLYLGPSLPAAEIASAAHQHKAEVVALSLVFPGDDDTLGHELRTLRTLLPAGTELLVGGRAAQAYAGVLHEVQAVQVDALDNLYVHLERFRGKRGRAASPEPRSND